MDYASVRTLHITCAGLSIALFGARGLMQIGGIDWRRWRWLRIAPHLNDTVLLSAAVALAWLSGQYPLALPWLTAKVLGLLLYIMVGRIALRPDVSPATRALAFAGALASVGYIVGVAVTRSPALGLL
ncbi:MAG: SirB2 family protein [Burkholderiaceae bacterium]|nr:SirB2 family protein [Burkholderiaceae bacterium]